MPFDLQSAQVAVGIIIGLLTILGTIFGWFGKVWRWVSSLFKPKPPVGVIDVPSKTMDDDIQKYIRCMDEIKLRDKVVEDNLSGVKSTGQPMTDIEFICLQFRKISELIMLSALCAHKKDYLLIHQKIEKEWDANKIRKAMENIHPDFYPTPFRRVINSIDNSLKNEKIEEGYLTKDECIELIGRCGGILHAFNPYNDEKKFKEVEAVKSNFKDWQKKIRELLFQHEIKLLGTDKQLWVYLFHGKDKEVLLEERVPISRTKNT